MLANTNMNTNTATVLGSLHQVMTLVILELARLGGLFTVVEMPPLQVLIQPATHAGGVRQEYLPLNARVCAYVRACVCARMR